MIRFDKYCDSFPNARLTRSKSGVLEVALHTDGGVLVFNGYTHEQFVDLFHAIGADPDNRVVILTGSGNAFMESITLDGFDFFSPRGYDKIYREGKKVLMNILDIEVPLIAAVNGPVRLHSEYILLADIVLATPSTVFQDKPHFEFGIVPGDGVNLLWQEVIGTVRGRSFILTRQELDAETAKEWGAVNEIVPTSKLLARAREIAEGLANFTGAGEQLACRHDFVDSAPFLGGLGIELLAGEDEVTAAHGADHFLPQQIDAIAGHDAEFEVRLILKDRRGGSQHDVGEQDIFGVQPHRAVHRGDQRHLDVEDVHEDSFALAIDLVVALRAEEVEAVGADRLHERGTAAGEDDDASIGIGADRVKEIDELFVGVPVEDQRTAIRVKRHFQHATL